MTTASSDTRSAEVVRAVADGAMPSSLTASAAASLGAVGILIEVLVVSSSSSSRSSLIRSITVCSSMRIMYHAPVVQNHDRPGKGAHVLLGSESCRTGTRARSGSRTGMLMVACGQGRRGAASLNLDCFIAVTATRILGDWMSVLRP